MEADVQEELWHRITYYVARLNDVLQAYQKVSVATWEILVT
jgi:hypothetical protein